MQNLNFHRLARIAAVITLTLLDGATPTDGLFPFHLVSSVSFPNMQTASFQAHCDVHEPNSTTTQTFLAAAYGGFPLPTTLLNSNQPSSDHHAFLLQSVLGPTTNLNAPHAGSVLPRSYS